MAPTLTGRSRASDVVIIGAGIGGLTLALELHEVGIPCRVFEAAPKIRPLGMGINIQPYASEVFSRLRLLGDLQQRAVTTREFLFCNRFGQEVWRMPAGQFAGHRFPQLSIHRADLHEVLVDAVRSRIGADRLHTGWRCVGVDQDTRRAWAEFVDSATGEKRPPQEGAVVVGADGIHSVVYRVLHPDGPSLRYSGTNMWRGTTVWPDFLSGASMVRAGLPDRGKLVVYPVRRDVDGSGNNLVNWVAEIDTPDCNLKATNEVGHHGDLEHVFAEWHFEWLDVSAFLRRANLPVLKFPMMDRDPLAIWGVGRITLLGDAAHPMVPLGSNGAGQAILDARALAARLAAEASVDAGLQRYEEERRPSTTNIVLGDRRGVVDLLVREVDRRTGGQPFENLNDVISPEELARLSVPDYGAAAAGEEAILAMIGCSGRRSAGSGGDPRSRVENEGSLLMIGGDEQMSLITDGPSNRL